MEDIDLINTMEDYLYEVTFNSDSESDTLLVRAGSQAEAIHRGALRYNKDYSSVDVILTSRHDATMSRYLDWLDRKILLTN